MERYIQVFRDIRKEHIIHFDTDKLYTRAALARAVEIPYHTLYAAETRGEIPTPGLPLWRRKYYSQQQLMLVIAWAEAKRRAAA